MSNVISLKKISKAYGKRVLFEPFTYDFPNKGVVAILGESGSGKTTLLNLIAGLDFNYDGVAKIDGVNLSTLSQNDLSDFRINKIGYVFQNFNLLNLETVYTNVSLPIDSISLGSKRIRKKRVLELLKLLQIEKLRKMNVNKLSGGEKQRVAISRAIVNEPKIILCDEPTGSLDEENSEKIYQVLKRISSNSLVVIATHDKEGIEKIANVILEIKNNKIEAKTLLNPKQNEDIRVISGGAKTKKSGLPLSFKIKHSVHKIRTKKWRSLITNTMLSLSLTGVGLSLIITNSVSKKVNQAFSDIINGNQIIMTTKMNSQNSFTTSYSASYSAINSIKNKYESYLDGIGVNYLVNFEDFFRDHNDFYITKGSKLISIPSFSVRMVNDFTWLENSLGFTGYPYSPSLLDDDQLVLGLPYEVMVQVCYSLQIQRTYTSLGHYLHENNTNLLIKLSNYSWQYEDEQIFNVVAVCESKIPRIYHTNPLWNEYVFENMMGIPYDDDNEHVYPWEMFKIYYLKTRNDPSEFINAISFDDEYFDYVFERTNYDYNPSICSMNETCIEHRVYVYSVDKFGVNLSDVDKIAKEINCENNYLFTSSFGYSSFASSLLSGFSRNFFVSDDENAIDDSIDADTALGSETNLEINLPENVVQGNYLYSMSEGLRFSTIMDELIYGRKPKNLNEIVISSGLNEKFGNALLGKYLQIGAEINEYLDGDQNLIKEYRKSKVLVVGVVNEKKPYFYHSNYWTISFFRDILGVSSFYLIPSAAIFELPNTENSELYLKNLSLKYPNYSFENPLVELNNSINNTLEYANLILIAFTVISILISSMLLGTVTMLSIIESKNEVDLFRYLGIRKKDSYSLFTWQSITQSFIAFFFSAIELFIIDFLMTYLLGDFLNIGITFSLNLMPFLVVFLVALLLPIFISKTMVFFMKYKLNK